MPSKRAKGTAKTGRAKQSTVGRPSKQSARESKPASAAGTTARARAGKKRDGKTAAKPRGIIQRAASSVRRVLSRVTGRAKTTAITKDVERPKGRKAERTPKLQTDIPMDRIAETYTPNQTSLKGPFRSSGADQQDDQEFARGVADDRWNDEDRMTNKSGDPRIGTHGRSYEPGEARAASGRKRNDD